MEKFKGYVKNLNSWYKNALFTIAPILVGSGMKTKVAENLMHGKYIVGLKEAFVGYEKHSKFIGKECTTSKCVIDTINKYNKRKNYLFNSKLRDTFMKNYSHSSMKKNYLNFFRKF